ncbi:MAG: hypothetical protein ACRCYU_22160 [Nocardioides sp.]
MQARTDIEVVDKDTMIATVDAAPAARPGTPTAANPWLIRHYRVKTTDGGRTWNVLGKAGRKIRAGDDALDHSIMPSTVRLSSETLVSASRDGVERGEYDLAARARRQDEDLVAARAERMDTSHVAERGTAVERG